MRVAKATTLSCTEAGVPDGTWYYTNTPKVAGSLWLGTESAKSAGVLNDITAPVVSTTVIAKTVGYLAGSIKQGGTFYVYANITDASSITTVTVNNSTLVASGGTAVALTAGSYSVQGISYNYRARVRRRRTR